MSICYDSIYAVFYGEDTSPWALRLADEGPHPIWGVGGLSISSEGTPQARRIYGCAWVASRAALCRDLQRRGLYLSATSTPPGE